MGAFSKKKHKQLPSMHRTPLSLELRNVALRETFKYPLLQREKKLIRCKAKYRESTIKERHLQNFYFQLLRKFYGRSSESRRYLARRKAKRNALNDRIDQHMASIQANAARDWEQEAQDNEPLVFSDDEPEESDYNYYTDEDDESSYTTQEEEEPYQKWQRLFRGFGALMVPIMISAGLGAYLAHLQSKKPPQAWSLFGGSSSSTGGSKDSSDAPVNLKKNELKGRCKAVQYPANAPCQDRLACQQINVRGFKGIYAAVFDGNSGWQLADDCSKKLHTYLEEHLKNAKTDEQVKEAIRKAFEQMDDSWIKVARAMFDKGFPTAAYVSSTALIALVRDNKLYIANAGDSKAVLLRHKEDLGGYQLVKVSKTFSINKKEEQARMKKEFPGERDIFQCLKQPTGIQCYVKGGLQPTRSFGDFRLKHREFNFHNYSEDLGYRLPIPVFSGPYISSVPDIQVHELTSEDKYLILASDGLWNYFPSKNTATLVKNTLIREEKKGEENKAQPVNPSQAIIRA